MELCAHIKGRGEVTDDIRCVAPYPAVALEIKDAFRDVAPAQHQGGVGGEDTHGECRLSPFAPIAELRPQPLVEVYRCGAPTDPRRVREVFARRKTQARGVQTAFPVGSMFV